MDNGWIGETSIQRGGWNENIVSIFLTTLPETYISTSMIVILTSVDVMAY